MPRHSTHVHSVLVPVGIAELVYAMRGHGGGAYELARIHTLRH
jgi:hypothetical protein